MNSSSLHFLCRRYKPSGYFLSNSPRSYQFQHSFIQRCPAYRSQLKNFKANLLIPNNVKPPFILQEQIGFFPIVFCTIGQRPNKYVSINTPQKYSSQRLCGRPYWNHMTPYRMCSRRAAYNTICPEVTSPTDKSITEQISPENTSNSQNTQRNPHSKRHPGSPKFSFTSVIRCVENSNQYTETVSTCQTCYSH